VGAKHPTAVGIAGNLTHNNTRLFRFFNLQGFGYRGFLMV
jgi:hypothetical protein